MSAVPEPSLPQAEPAIPRLVPYEDYSGDLWHRPALTGDWGGLRQKLMDKGVRLDTNLTQVYQGNVAGGTQRKGRYMGLLDYTLQLDTGPMGLWPGGMLKVQDQSRYGRSDNDLTGALSPVNTVSLKDCFKNGLSWVPLAACPPVLLFLKQSFNPVGTDEDISTLTEFYYVQGLAPQLAIALGKFAPEGTNVFAGDWTEQFLNASLNFNPIIGTTVPITADTAGLILMPTKWLTSSVLVMDAEGNANSSGCSTAFNRGTDVLQINEFAIKPFGLPGNQRII